MERRIVVSLLVAGMAVACADMPNAPLPSPAFEPVFIVSDPPPPPADGTENIWDGSGCAAAAACPNEEGPYIQVLALQAHYFKAPGAFNAFVTFSSDAPFVEISPNARVRDNSSGVEGSGTIASWAFLDQPSQIATPIIVDLSTASGSLHSGTGARNFFFTARAVNAITGIPLIHDVLFWYSY